MSDKKISKAIADELFNLIKKHGADISQVLALVTSIYMTTEDASVMTAVIQRAVKPLSSGGGYKAIVCNTINCDQTAHDPKRCAMIPAS